MSDRDPPDDGEKKPHLRLVGKPGSTPHPSPPQIEQLYMASVHIEWTPFAKSMGWSPTSSRKGLPVDDWTKAKRDIIAREQAENLAEMVFNHESRWHQNVLETLEEHPRVHKAMHQVLSRRLSDIMDVLREDDRRELEHRRAGLPMEEFQKKFDSIPTKDLASLTNALNQNTAAMHKSLMLDTWSYKVAKSYTDPAQFSREQEKIDHQTWQVTLMGSEKVSMGEMQKFVTQWYDKPKLPHKPADLEPSE